jgi:hypothetical protein
VPNFMMVNPFVLWRKKNEADYCVVAGTFSSEGDGGANGSLEQELDRGVNRGVENAIGFSRKLVDNHSKIFTWNQRSIIQLILIETCRFQHGGRYCLWYQSGYRGKWYFFNSKYLIWFSQ